MVAILRQFIRITVSIHRPVVKDRREWVVLQQFWELTGEPRTLNLTQSNLLLYERHKNLRRDPGCSRDVGDSNGEKGEGSKVSRHHFSHFDFEYVFSPKIFFD